MRNSTGKLATQSLPLGSLVISTLLFLASGAAASADEQNRGGAVLADAFRADTIFYAELREPVAIVDRFSRMSFWPHVVSLMTEAAGLVGSSERCARNLSFALGAWGEESEFRRHVARLAGARCAIGLVPIEGSKKVVPLFVFERTATEGSLLPLTALARALDEGSKLRIDGDPRGGAPGERFSIVGAAGRPLLVGGARGRWLVLSAPAGSGPVSDAINALGPGGGSIDQPLSAVEGFRMVMSELPESADGRVYVSSAGIIEMIDRCGALSPLGKRLAKACFCWTGSIGIAREIGTDSIRTWVTGEIEADEMDAAVPGLLDTLGPIGEPLCRWFPRDALAAYEVGVPPEALLDTIGFFVKSVSPRLHREIDMLRAEFVEATGLDPAVDLFPYLGGSVAVAALPSEGLFADWPFARSVMLVRVTDEQKARAFVSSFLRWDASMWAPFTGGLIGGREVTSSHNGVELMGIEFDSLIGLPLPSPTVALSGGFLIASSFRSGVVETLDVLRGARPALCLETISGAGPIRDDAVELVHLNCPSWTEEWARCWKAAAGPCCHLFLDRDFVASRRLSGEKLDRLGRALFGVLTRLDRASGTTTIDSDGRFEFFIEARVR